MKGTVKSMWASPVLSGLVAVTNATAAIMALDDFNRANSASLGTTSVGGYPWNENETAGEITLDTSTARFASRGTGTDPSATLGLSLQNLDLSVTINGFHTASDNYFGGLLYRLGSTSSTFAGGSAGYGVRLTMGLWDGSYPANSVSLTWGNTLLAQYTNATAFVQGQDYRLRAFGSGTNQTVYLDGVPIISYGDSDLSHNVSGFVGMGTYYGNYAFDDFQVEPLVPEPTTVMLMLVGLATWKLRRGQRK